MNSVVLWLLVKQSMEHIQEGDLDSKVRSFRWWVPAGFAWSAFLSIASRRYEILNKTLRLHNPFRKANGEQFPEARGGKTSSMNGETMSSTKPDGRAMSSTKSEGRAKSSVELKRRVTSSVGQEGLRWGDDFPHEERGRVTSYTAQEQSTQRCKETEQQSQQCWKARLTRGWGRP